MEISEVEAFAIRYPLSEPISDATHDFVFLRGSKNVGSVRTEASFCFFLVRARANTRSSLASDFTRFEAAKRVER